MKLALLSSLTALGLVASAIAAPVENVVDLEKRVEPIVTDINSAKGKTVESRTAFCRNGLDCGDKDSTTESVSGFSGKGRWTVKRAEDKKVETKDGGVKRLGCTFKRTEDGRVEMFGCTLPSIGRL